MKVITKFKRHLGSACGDLLHVQQKLKLALDTQFVELRKKIEDDKIKIPQKYRLSRPMQRHLIGKISCFALAKLKEQLELAAQIAPPDDVCYGAFTRIWGLPCRHVIPDLLAMNGELRLLDVHPQWLLTLDTPNTGSDRHPPASPPAPLSPRSRAIQLFNQRYDNVDLAHAAVMVSRLEDISSDPLTSMAPPNSVLNQRGGAQRSNRRLRSLFEIVQGRKCSNCGRPGHNIRTCLL